VTQLECCQIHYALRDASIESIKVNGALREISCGIGGCHFMRVEGTWFIEHPKADLNKTPDFDDLAVTWICREGQWGLIVGNDIMK